MSKPLAERKHVGQDLARMIAVTQRVNDGYVGPPCQLFDGRLGENARHNALRPALQIAGYILYRLAFSDGSGVIHRIAAKLFDGELEGEPGAERGFFKQQAEVTSRE